MKLYLLMALCLLPHAIRASDDPGNPNLFPLDVRLTPSSQFSVLPGGHVFAQTSERQAFLISGSKEDIKRVPVPMGNPVVLPGNVAADRVEFSAMVTDSGGVLLTTRDRLLLYDRAVPPLKLVAEMRIEPSLRIPPIRLGSNLVAFVKGKNTLVLCDTRNESLAVRFEEDASQVLGNIPGMTDPFSGEPVQDGIRNLLAQDAKLIALSYGGQILSYGFTAEKLDLRASYSTNVVLTPDVDDPLVALSEKGMFVAAALDGSVYWLYTAPSGTVERLASYHKAGIHGIGGLTGLTDDRIALSTRDNKIRVLTRQGNQVQEMDVLAVTVGDTVGSVTPWGPQRIIGRSADWKNNFITIYDLAKSGKLTQRAIYRLPHEYMSLIPRTETELVARVWHDLYLFKP